MRTLTVLMLSAAMASAVSGCGFRPLYAPVESGSALSTIAIDEIEGRAGQSMRTSLDRFFSAGRQRGAEPAYRLSVKLEERLEPLGLRVDASATRTDLNLTANYVVTTVAGAEVFKGQITTTVGYDVPNSAFGEFSAQNDARERAGEVMAELLRAELAARIAPKP